MNRFSESYFMLTDDELLFSRATADRGLGKLPLAMADYARIIKVSPDAEAFRERADCEMQAKMYQQAVADYTACLNLHDDPAGTYLQRAKA